ncbi:MAG: hypothetical protein JWP59_2195 [Massilia sp.]|jgi:hypothetical protein|nr:hypothetical protein [Massilia sp.]
MTVPPDPRIVAADLLDEVAKARQAAPRPVPLLLRSPELMALDPALRVRVLAHARRATAADPKTLLALVLWGACMLALLFTAAPSQLGPLLLVGWVPALLIHTNNVRRAARRLARDLA